MGLVVKCPIPTVTDCRVFAVAIVVRRMGQVFVSKEMKIISLLVIGCSSVGRQSTENHDLSHLHSL